MKAELLNDDGRDKLTGYSRPEKINELLKDERKNGT